MKRTIRDIGIHANTEARVIERRLTMPSRCGTVGRGKECACLGLPDAFALEWEQGNHTPSPGAKLRLEVGLCGSGSVVSVCCKRHIRDEGRPLDGD